ncbi:probable low affinity copper uptake protein 2 [Octopus bimaculoides]|uniref:Copper transport protein n=1 Tax=Octopus bimaculoides TaxID=37653 RepID=A0A0L8H6H2_OCTBM|nr:probable low affinity copper uptake protein 2 [Octopus bimaculoides]|eukprot:XP_014775325.1 PREDICTED: probable low affinity copper uptake protein 2 [Octopus bimaculoides]
MYLFMSSKVSNLLFEGWNSTDFPGMIVMFTVTTMVAIIYDAIRLLHAFLHIKARQNPILYSQEESEPTSENSVSNSLQALISPLSTSVIKRKRRLYYLAETVMHMLLTFIGYLIMLLVMTFNGWFAIAVLLGATIGFFLFDASILTLAYKSPNTSSRHRASSSDPVPTVTHSTELESRSSDISI